MVTTLSEKGKAQLAFHQELEWGKASVTRSGQKLKKTQEQKSIEKKSTTGTL